MGGLLVTVVVVLSTVVIVRDGCFVRGTLCWDGGVALLLRRDTIVACGRVRGGVVLYWTILIGGRSSTIRR